jgi:GT2 family glycosyltransferase
MLTVVVLNYNDSDTTINMVNSIKDYLSIDYILIIDNKSTDDSLVKLQELSCEKIHVVETKYNGGYGYGNNFGIIYSMDILKSDYVLIVNPDVCFSEKTVMALERALVDNNVGVVTAFMKSPDGTRSPLAAWKIPTITQYLFSNTFLGKIPAKLFGTSEYKDLLTWDKQAVEVECVPGSMIMVNAKIMREYGMYDNGIFLFCEETVLGIKLRNNGIKTLLLPTEEFIHHHSVSIDKTFRSNIKKLKLMWTSRIYVLINYYKINTIILIIAKLIAEINILEYRLYYFIKKFKYNKKR